LSFAVWSSIVFRMHWMDGAGDVEGSSIVTL